jgi:hypothetical protein
MSSETMETFVAMMATGVMSPEDFGAMGMDPVMVMGIAGDFEGLGRYAATRMVGGNHGGGGGGGPGRGGNNPPPTPPQSAAQQSPTYCSVCSVPVAPGNMDTHVAGRKHQKTLSRGSSGGGEGQAKRGRGDGAPQQPARRQPGVSAGGGGGKPAAATAAAATQAPRRVVDPDYPHLHPSKEGDYGMTRGDVGKLPGITVHVANSDQELAKLANADVRVLYIGRGCTSEGLRALAVTAPHLQHIENRGSRVTGDGLCVVAEWCPHLEVLDLKEIMCFGQRQMNRLRALLPRLKYVDARETEYGRRMASEFPPNDYAEQMRGSVLIDL